MTEKVAIVVGGGQTLGAFLCTGLAENGYRVAVADLNGDNAIKTANQINQKLGKNVAQGFQVDATNEQSVITLAHNVDQAFGRSDLLVYSAGMAKAAPITEFQIKDFDTSLQVNLVGYFLCAREFSKLMIRDHIPGRIIQIR